MSNYAALHTLVTLRQEKSLTATANIMGIAKSTLSRRLATLEEQLGYRLTHQVNGRLLLTPAGDCYADYAIRILKTAAEAEQALHALSKNIQGELCIQLCPNFPMGWSIKALTIFLQQHLQVQLKIETLHSVNNLETSQDYNDLYISCKPLKLTHYKEQPLGQWQLAMYQAAKCETVNLKAGSFKELKQFNWIVSAFENTINLTHSQTKETQQFIIQPRLQLDSLTLQAEAIAKGYGVGVLPKWMAECPKHGWKDKFKMIDTEWEVEPAQLMLYYKKNPSSALQALIKHLQHALPPYWRIDSENMAKLQQPLNR